MKDLRKEIKAYALKQAIEYGNAESKRIIPKLFQHGLKKDEIKEALKEAKKIAEEVNKLEEKERKEIYGEYKSLVIEHKEKEKDFPELPNASKGVITRIPPEPSKHLHIGHALSFILNYVYAEKYGGKCLLRFEDCNPEKVSKDYADSNLDDINNYLGIKLEGIKYVSDDLPIMYKHAETLIMGGSAFMCFCSREKMQDLRHKGIECECRKQDTDKNKKEWKKFLEGKYINGEGVLRFKGEMNSDFQVLRDPVLFRAVKAKHFRQGSKYKIWPMYDFYNPIEDDIMGITHILRSIEFEQRVPLHDKLRELLGLKKQTIVQYGRFNVIESTTKGREIREMIESGEYIGWDDPRLVTLKALKRRGIIKESFYELAKNSGFSRHEVNIDFSMIAAINRKILDKKANRYFFVSNPVQIKIKNLPKIDYVKAKMHPEKEEERKIKVRDEIFVSKEDYESFKGKETRLMSFCNVFLEKKAEFTSLENKNIQKIQWVGEGIKSRIFMPDATWVSGIAEEAVSKLSPGDIIQFERFGFCRFDRKNKDVYEFWFGHK